MCVKGPRRWILASAWLDAKVWNRHHDSVTFSVSPSLTLYFPHLYLYILCSLILSLFPGQSSSFHQQRCPTKIRESRERVTSLFSRVCIFPQGSLIGPAGSCDPCLGPITICGVWCSDWLGWATYLPLRQMTQTDVVDNCRKIIWDWAKEEFLKEKKF